MCVRAADTLQVSMASSGWRHAAAALQAFVLSRRTATGLQATIKLSRAQKTHQDHVRRTIWGEMKCKGYKHSTPVMLSSYMLKKCNLYVHLAPFWTLIPGWGWQKSPNLSSKLVNSWSFTLSFTKYESLLFISPLLLIKHTKHREEKLSNRCCKKWWTKNVELSVEHTHVLTS